MKSEEFREIGRFIGFLGSVKVQTRTFTIRERDKAILNQINNYQNDIEFSIMDLKTYESPGKDRMVTKFKLTGAVVKLNL